MSRPANAPGWADPERGLAWIVTPSEGTAYHVIGKLLQPIAEHEIGHLLGADHATLTRYPTHCVSHGSAVQAAWEQGAKR